MNHSNFFYLLLILIGGHCFAQPQFRYKRNISGVAAEGWYVLPLPPDIFKDLSRELGDIRLYASNQHDTLELPYLLRVRQDQVENESVQLSLFNRSTRDGILFLTFELPPSRKVNYIHLQFLQLNYFGFVTIEGSDDKLQWFSIVNDQRIVSVLKDGRGFEWSTVDFPITNYRYLRVAVRADIPLTFQGASFHYNRLKPGVYQTIPVTWKMDTEKNGRRSFIDVKLEHEAPVSSIAVETDIGGNDYYRAFRIEYVYDSTRSEKGWVKYYRRLYEGYLTSFKPNKFMFDRQTVKEIRLVIEDNDNAPLDIRNVTVSGPEVQLVSYLKPGVNFMLYGADVVAPPAYDLAYFENKIPADPLVAQLALAENIAEVEVETSPLFQNKMWLWSLMGLMIGGLGFYTIRMMRGKS